MENEKSCCPHCGKALMAQMPLCPHCGFDLENEQKSTQEEPFIPSPTTFLAPSPKDLSSDLTNDLPIESVTQPKKINNRTPLAPKKAKQTSNSEPFRPAFSDELLEKIQNLVENKQKKYKNYALIFAFAGLLLVFLPPFWIEPMEGGGALLLLGLLVFPTSIFVYFLYKKRSKVLGNMLTGESLLACFFYEKDSYQEQIEARFQENQNRNKIMFNFIFVITLIVCIGLLLLSGFETEMWLTVGFMMGFMIFLKLFSYAIPFLTRKKERESVGLVLISKDGVWQAGYLHSWVHWRTRLKSVKWDKAKKELSFRYSAPVNLYLTRELLVRVEVPKGREAEGEAVAAFFGSKKRN
ncbi:zinc ribbon domain-containing protein [Hugenholtzia roseola]|uniref:zinc ribbon domain-containing protein n=1 Tax=Hugenholtzia roseola TaxID=1002 RepID=UPI00047C7470|nr:zinc ribbon domain-containing protein [Hugenholtzia roseola]